MPEEQAFCTLVKIMFDYGLRDLFKLGLDVLHLRFYQLQRLTEVSSCSFSVAKSPGTIISLLPLFAVTTLLLF